MLDYDRMDYLSYRNSMKAEGKAEGKVEGANEQANATAEKMLKRSKPLSEIVDFSGLTETAVKDLAEKLKIKVVVE